MLFNKNNQSTSSKIKPVTLLVLDGWGVAPKSEGNAIYLAKTPNMDKYQASYPHGELIAAGESVGLPAGDVGNSEVGHLTIGAGRVMLQSIERIAQAIEDGQYYKNDVFLNVAKHIKTYQSNLHIMGLASSGSVHSNIEHLYALLKFCKKQNLSSVYLHLFTDGRDAPPEDGIKVITRIEEKLKEIGVGKIATISGRYFAMDRDGRWERTQKTYDAMTIGQGNVASSAVEAINASYQDKKTDEFIEPFVVTAPQGKPIGMVNDNDAAIFFNFRIDRPRQLAMAFVMKDFESADTSEFGFTGTTFRRQKFVNNLFFVTMTEYHKNIPVSAIAFPPEQVNEPLGKVISDNRMLQLSLAESEKERMVTFYYNGLHSDIYPGQEVKIVPSPKVPTYDKKPEMSVYGIVDEYKKALSRDYYHFYFMNFANPDMVAHSGSIKATIKACAHVDKAIGMLVSETLKKDGTVIITADHGNAEDLLTFPSSTYYYTSAKGSVNTEHSANPVPVVVINNDLLGKSVKLPAGSLADIAPTVLTLLNLPIPPVMTGKNLLE